MDIRWAMSASKNKTSVTSFSNGINSNGAFLLPIILLLLHGLLKMNYIQVPNSHSFVRLIWSNFEIY